MDLKKDESKKNDLLLFDLSKVLLLEISNLNGFEINLIHDRLQNVATDSEVIKSMNSECDVAKSLIVEGGGGIKRKQIHDNKDIR